MTAMRVGSSAFAIAWIALLLAVGSGDGFAAGDPIRGASAFRQCASCHSTAPGVHMTGPSLARVWGMKAGSAEGFHRYSDALKSSGITWNARTLDRWLSDPAAFVRGSGMIFPGVKSAAMRSDLIAYLKSISEGTAPSQGVSASGMTGRAGKPDLKQAPPEGRVASISHCGDTYTVKTADGKTNKVWEFNLRFKTDSSPDGPAPGEPVIVGAGMRGDRASVVFAAPAEISRYIRESCD